MTTWRRPSTLVRLMLRDRIEVATHWVRTKTQEFPPLVCGCRMRCGPLQTLSNGHGVRVIACLCCGSRHANRSSNKKQGKVMTPVLAARILPLRSSRWLMVGIAVLASGCVLFDAKPNIMLSGREEIPAVSSMGFGMGRILVGKDKRVSGSIKVSSVEVTAAHIHVGGMGQIGPPIVTLNKVSSKVWAVPMDAVLSDGQFNSYMAGKLYINVHSKAHKGGEIRGQLQPAAP